MQSVKIEQSATLNQHLSFPAAKTKAEIGRILLAFSAFSLPICSLIFSQKLFINWLKNKPIELPASIAIALTPLAFFVFFVPLMLLFAERASRLSKRTLRLNRFGFSRQPGKFIGWRNMLGWHLEPLPSEPHLQRLTLVYFLFGDRKLIKHWSIMIANKSQLDFFQSYLEFRKQSGKEVPPQLAELPPITKPQPISPFGWMFLSTALCLILPAVFAMMAAVHFLRAPIILINQSILKENPGNLELFVLNHFTSSHEMGWMILCIGLLLILVGFASYSIGNRFLGGTITGYPKPT